MAKSLINVVINSKVIGIANVQELRTALIGVQQAAEQSAGAMAKWDAHKTITACGALSSSLNNLMSSLNFATEGFESFDKAMRAANTMAGKDAAGFERLKDQVTELGKSIPLTRDALANGLYQVISNGVPEDNWLAFLEASAKSAVGGLADLGGVVTVTSTIIKNYGLDWSEALAVQNKIQTTAQNGVTSFEQLQQALPRVTGNAATLGVSIDELMAAFATLTGVSGNTAEVSTQLAAIFTALVKPSSEATKTAQAMGIQFNAAAIKAAGGFGNFVKQLDSSVKAYAASSGTLEQEVYGKLFGSAESLRALIPLTGKLADKYGENVAAMAASSGAVNDVFGQIAQTAESKAQLTKNAWAGVTDALGSCLSAIKPFVNGLAQTGMAASGIAATYAAIKKISTSFKSMAANASNAGMSARVVATNIATLRFIPIASETRVLATSLDVSAKSAFALGTAMRWLAAGTVVGLAIWGISAAIEAAGEKSRKAAEEEAKFRAELDALRKSSRDITTASTQAAAAEMAKVNALMSVIRDGSRTRMEQKNALDELKRLYPDYFSQLDTERSKVEDIETAYNNVAIAIKKKAMATALEQKMADNAAKMADLLLKRKKYEGLYTKGEEIVNPPQQKIGEKRESDPFWGNMLPEDRKSIGQNFMDSSKKEIDKIQEQITILENSQNELEALFKENVPSTPPRTTTDLDKNKPLTEKEKAAAIDVDEVRKRELKTAYDYDKALSDLRLKAIYVGAEERAQIKETIKAIEEKRRAFDGEAPMSAEQVMEMPEDTFNQLSAKIREMRRLWGDASGEAAQAYLEQIEAFEKRLAEMRSKPLLTKEQAMAMPTDTLNQIDAKIAELQRVQADATGEAVRQLQEEIETLQDLRGEMLKVEKTKIKKKENPFKDFSSVQKMQAGWGAVKGLKGDVDSLTAAFDNSATVWERVSSGIDAAFGMFEHIQTIVQLFDSLKASQEAAGAAAVVSAATQTAAAQATIPVIKEEANANVQDAGAKAMNAHSWIPFVGIALGAASVAMMIASLFGLPKFADGGIAFGPTLGLFGEYAGASNNPEVVAPLSRLKDLIEPQGGAMRGKLKFEIEGRKLVAVYDSEKRRRSRS